MKRKILIFLILSVTLLASASRVIAAPQEGLIKASGPAVYYYGGDGKRYVFPNQQTFYTWYSDFSGVQTLSDGELGAIPIGGSVTYRPGVKLVKITTDPKVYAVDNHGTLRWVTTEAIAAVFYGAHWTRIVDDVPDAFFANYRVGSPIIDIDTYNQNDAKMCSPNLKTDLRLGTIVECPPLYDKPTFSIEVDDNGFYPNMVIIRQGQSVRMNFRVRSADVYFGSLDIRSTLFSSLNVKAGEEASVDFIAPDMDTVFFSYWPSSSMQWEKGTVKVRVIPQ